MANRLTRIPERPVPVLPGWVLPAVPVADVFMLLMASRPSSGSLARTWVTPATLQMCVAVVVACVLGGALAAPRAASGSGLALGLCAGLLLFAIGSGAVAVVGLAQRRA